MLVAKELSYYPNDSQELQQQNRKTKNKKNRKRQKKRSTNQSKNNGIIKLFIMSIPLVVLSIALLILFRYANITAVRQEITDLERKKVELEKTKLNLAAEVEGIKSSVKIADDAMEKLGMNYPSEGQIAYVSIDNNANEDIDKIKMEDKIKKILGMVTSLF